MIVGKKITLGPVIISDNYYNWMNDTKTTQYLESRYWPQTKEALQKYVSEQPKDVFFLGIIQNHSLNHVGNIKLGPVNWLHKFAEIGIVIQQEDWGKGYGTEAISLITEFAFTTLGLHKVWAGCLSENIGSIKAFQKAEFMVEGRLMNQYWHDGKYIDDIILGKIKE